MILLCGIPSEPPISLVASALNELHAFTVMLNQRQYADTGFEFVVSGSAITGRLEIDNAEYRLEDFQAVYVRLMDDRFLPEVEKQPPTSPLRAYCRQLHDRISVWLDLCDARVVNRPSMMASNNSKPFQAQLISEQGFNVPETLITNDPEAVLDFRSRHRKLIYKSISGVRSIVQTLDEAACKRLHLIRWCPVQFQEFIEGEDVRVHVVGSKVFATRIRSNAIDYRYSQQQLAEPAELEEFELPPAIAERCINLSVSLSLPFSGIDLRMCPDGQVYCFEVNPSPGFSYYQSHTGQQIARAVAEHLTGRCSDPHPKSA
jgi:hypothetical protein